MSDQFLIRHWFEAFCELHGIDPAGRFPIKRVQELNKYLEDKKKAHDEKLGTDKWWEDGEIKNLVRKLQNSKFQTRERK